MQDFDLPDAVNHVTTCALNHPCERDAWEKSPAVTGMLLWNDKNAMPTLRA